MSKIETAAAPEASSAAASPPPAAPATPIQETPEFKAALAEATSKLSMQAAQDAAVAARDSVAAMVAAEVGKIMAAQGATKGDTVGNLSTVLSDLAFSIAQTNDPDHGRKLIAPAELERRKAGLTKMGELLTKVQADKSIKPMYEVRKQTFLAEQLIQAQKPGPNNTWIRTQIIWRGAPNSCLAPVNDIAKEIYTYYLVSIGGSTENPAGVRDKPTWVGSGNDGLVFVGDPPQSVQKRGLVAGEAAPLELGVDLANPTLEITSTDDLNATRIPILGTRAAPARVTANGSLAVVNVP